MIIKRIKSSLLITVLLSPVLAGAGEDQVLRVRSRDWTCHELRDLLSDEQRLFVNGRPYGVTSRECGELLYFREFVSVGGFERASDKLCNVGWTCSEAPLN